MVLNDSRVVIISCFGNLKVTNLFTLKFHFLNDGAQGERRVELHSYDDACRGKHFKFVIH